MAEQQLRGQDKLTLLLTLVPYLVERGRVGVAEAAEHFGVTPEQLREAVTLIAVSGVPGQTRQYQPDDLFDIAWDSFEEDDEIELTHLVALDETPRFSAPEAAALIAGLQYVQALPENAERPAITALMSKLARGSSGTPSPLAVGGGRPDATLGVVREAIEAGRRLEFDYRSSRGESSRRTIDPLRIDSLDRDWYVRGWDHAREASRTFRIDRMSEVRVGDEPATEASRRVRVPDHLFEPSPDDVEVDVEVPAGALALLGGFVDSQARIVEHDGRLRLTLRLAHHRVLGPLASRLAGVLTVLGPPEARRAVVEWAQAGLRRYDDDPAT